MDDGEVDQVLDVLTNIDMSEHVRAVTDLLIGGVTESRRTMRWHEHPQSFEIARTAWRNLADEPVPDPPRPWLSRTINHSAGNLAQFWTQATAAQWRATTNWDGLPNELREGLEEGLRAGGLRSVLFSSFVASQSLFYFGADREWWQEMVLPLFDWQEPEIAAAAWDGFTTWGRWNDAMLADGLYDRYLHAIPQLELLSDEAQSRFLRHLALLSMVSDINPRDAGLLDTIITTLSEPDVRASWADEVSSVMQELPEEAVNAQWSRWVVDYWNDRLNSTPIRMTQEEASAMAGWAVLQTEHQTRAAELAVATTAWLDPHASVLRLISDDTLHDSQAVANVVRHLLRNTDLPFYGCHNDVEVLRLLDGIESDTLQEIQAQALRLRCGAAELGIE